jgi:preprotein translocase subunit SecY
MGLLYLYLFNATLLLLLLLLAAFVVMVQQTRVSAPPTTNKHVSLNLFVSFLPYKVALGGLVVSVLATGPKVRGFNPS